MALSTIVVQAGLIKRVDDDRAVIFGILMQLQIICAAKMATSRICSGVA